VNHEVVRTRGGVLAVRSVADGEIMHPGVGPLVEAQQLYVQQSRLAERLLAAPGETLVLFDVGLGAGSNAVAARAVSEASPAGAGRLEVISFERDLDALELALEHGVDFGLDGEAGQAARALIRDGRHETPRTLWRLTRGDALQSMAQERALADLVFWDPFSPRVNGPLWTVAAFTAVRRLAGPRCLLLTYSASTAVRVAMLLAGWAVGIGDGIGDKAQTTAAAVDVAQLRRPLEPSWLRRLQRADAPWPADAPADAVARVRSAPQFSGG
jgi:queuine tRNA-ribosyltransferase